MLSRREFIRLFTGLMAGLYLPEYVLPKIAEAVGEKEKPPVIWLEMMTCEGDILSSANTMNPSMKDILFEIIDLRFTNTLMAAEGDLAIKAFLDNIEKEKGRYILIAEGTVPVKAGGLYSIIGHYPDGRPITSLEAIKLAAPNAKYIMCIGTCACFGGPFAARPNPSGSKPVSSIIEEQVVNVSGCPVNPDWSIGTLIHLILYGMPELDGYHRPTMFFGKRIHDWCPRRQHFDNGNFASHPGQEACVYKIGCKGPVTFSDCPTRQWNSEHSSWPVEVNSPCIGCVSPNFPDGMSPFFEHLSDVTVPGGIRASTDTIGLGVAGAAALGIGGHLVANTLSGRVGKHLIDGTEATPMGLTKINPGPTGNKRIVKLKPKGRLKQIGIKRHWKQVQVGKALTKKRWLGRLSRLLPGRKGRR